MSRWPCAPLVIQAPATSPLLEEKGKVSTGEETREEKVSKVSTEHREKSTGEGNRADAEELDRTSKNINAFD
jgi:hypothetical protein